MLKLSSIFILFFITLGPMKTIAPFVQLTAGADAAFCRTIALRATLAATVVVLILSLVGPLILQNWGVSFPAVALTGGAILFLLSLQLMMKSTESADNKGKEPETLPEAMLISRLVIPTIVTPPGIAAVLALMVFSAGNPQLWLQTIGLLLLVMLLNLLIMLAAQKILNFLTIAGLRVIGWVFAVLQASLGMQVVINSLQKLGALPIQ